MTFRCECIFTSDTVNGLQVHLSCKHPEIRNEQLKIKKNFAWTDPELEYLAEKITSLKKDAVKKVNEVASGFQTEQQLQLRHNLD